MWGGGAVVKTGSFTRSTSSSSVVNLGFRPRKVIIYTPGNASGSTPNGTTRVIYDADWTTGYVMTMTKGSSGSQIANTPYSDSSLTITSTGFSFAAASSSTYAIEHNYIAIG